jgi:hypothetical protein
MYDYRFIIIDSQTDRQTEKEREREKREEEREREVLLTIKK